MKLSCLLLVFLAVAVRAGSTGVRVGGGRGGQGRRRRRARHGGGPGGQVRVHGVRADGVDLEGRDELGDRRDAAGVGRHGSPDRRPGELWADGGEPRLLRARQPGHLQRPRALHGAPALLDEPHLRRHRLAPRLVLQLLRGHHHRPAPRLQAGALHRRAVARPQHPPLPPLRRPRQLPQEAAAEAARRLGIRRRRGRRRRRKGHRSVRSTRARAGAVREAFGSRVIT